MDRDTASLLPGTGVPATPPKQPQGDWLLHVCRVFNAVAALCALFCAVAFGMALVVRFSAPIKVRLSCYEHPAAAARQPSGSSQRD